MDCILTLCKRCTKCCSYLILAHRSFSSSSIALEASDFYDVLNVSRTASRKEIKQAYFSLSKQLHPDRNLSNPNHHKKFVELNEAYNVLSKPLSRRQYDERLSRLRWGQSTSGASSGQPHSNHYNWYHEVNHSVHSPNSKKGHFRGYYGIQGVDKLSNRMILYGVLIYFVAGIIVHYLVYQQSSEYTQQQLNEKDKKIALIYDVAKKRAMENGNQKQMQLIRKTHEDLQSQRLHYVNDDD
ncbi:dnaJ homolog subfamily C member 4-like isoform X2 [Anneissia japonica]|nr:dnaJ homolog subfamily C member 4-like isoform X2 [Anneissia japonica]XP_033105015.1 dnaJ homolog subfamily C member 4-like isoform X2 [Anneissia japonica]XP_033105016.1 dnaJ homolog subfamily C member 4-like isoform X2 [Anneissia japonica]